MDKVIFNKLIEHKLTPNEVARLFCSMDANEMAAFFHSINTIVKNEWDMPLEMQLAAVERNKSLTNEARCVMSAIGEYSSVKL